MNVLVVGAGAIGGPVALALAASPVGFELIRICDDDRVEASNLQRQIQFRERDIGALKVERLAEAAATSGTNIEGRPQRFDADSAAALLEDIDLVIDGSDNFATKFLVNDQALVHGIPAIIASAIGNSGQLFVVSDDRACYRCLFEAPPDFESGTCAQIGVLAPMPGLVAGHAVLAAARLAAGNSIDAPLTVFSSASAPPRTIDFQPRKDCSACQRGATRIAS